MSAIASQKREAAMTNRQRAMAVLRYEPYDRLPVVHFGYWYETLAKWVEEGHLTKAETRHWGDGNPTDLGIDRKLGFDFNWYSVCSPDGYLRPVFRRRILKKLPDGSRHVLSGEGVVVLEKPGIISIPAEIKHRLTDRASWEKHYKWRLQWSDERIQGTLVRVGDTLVRFDEGGLDHLQSAAWDKPYGLFCGSLYGHVRNMLGLERSCTLIMDDPGLYEEIINTMGELNYQNTKYILEAGARFDFAHFWEDICCKNGPLVSPSIFAALVGPHYRRITGLLKEHGIDIVSLDCDGLIDYLLPIWLQNGVNTMFPIEVGTWQASIAPWRAQYGKALRGVGGMNKNVFALDYGAIEEEIQRLKELVALGGYIPCPDHRIPPTAKWENVQYYCRRMREEFS